MGFFVLNTITLLDQNTAYLPLFAIVSSFYMTYIMVSNVFINDLYIIIKIKTMKKLILILLVFSLPFAQAQNFKLNPGSTELTIDGTSSIHDWTITAEQFTGNAEIVLEGTNIGDIKSLSFSVPVKSLKSGKSSMDDNTYEALKAKDHPTISYNLNEIVSKTKSGNSVVMDTKGNLTIAGVTKTINMKVTTDVSNNVVFDGKVTFKMTDFEVDPPTAVFGTIKTGDEITINFKANYTK
jgi:polyisoprenoid-binding protein YceI